MLGRTRGKTLFWSGSKMLMKKQRAEENWLVSISLFRARAISWLKLSPFHTFVRQSSVSRFFRICVRRREKDLKQNKIRREMENRWWWVLDDNRIPSEEEIPSFSVMQSIAAKKTIWFDDIVRGGLSDLLRRAFAIDRRRSIETQLERFVRSIDEEEETRALLSVICSTINAQMVMLFDIRLFLLSIIEVAIFSLQLNLSDDKCQQERMLVYMSADVRRRKEEKRVFFSSPLFISILDDKQHRYLDEKETRRQNG